MTLTLTYGNQANNSFPNLATSFQAFFLFVEQKLTFCYSSSHITIQYNTLLILPKGLFRINLQIIKDCLKLHTNAKNNPEQNDKLPLLHKFHTSNFTIS